MTNSDMEQLVTSVLYSTRDPETPSPFPDGGKLPALTTMLYRVCGNDTERFNEAVRLVTLFVRDAIFRMEAEK